MKKICKYSKCGVVISKYHKDSDYCYIHQDRMALAEDKQESYKDFLMKEKAWVQITKWKPDVAFAIKLYPRRARKVKTRQYGEREYQALFVKKSYLLDQALADAV